MLDILVEQGQNTVFSPETSYFPEVIRLKLGTFDPELNSASNIDRASECHKKYPNPLLTLSDFIHVLIFAMSAGNLSDKFVTFFLLHALPTVI